MVKQIKKGRQDIAGGDGVKDVSGQLIADSASWLTLCTLKDFIYLLTYLLS